MPRTGSAGGPPTLRGRLDWKYLLWLVLADPGFDAAVPSEFRSRIVAGGAEELLLDTLLLLHRERKLRVPRGQQRTDSTHVHGAPRSLSRLGCAIEALRAALNALTIAAPGWLREEPAVQLTRRVWIQNFCRCRSLEWAALENAAAPRSRGS